jgi:hypothetical protein
MAGFVESPDDVIARSRRNGQVGTVIHKFPRSEAIPYMMILGFKEYSYASVAADAGGTNVVNKESIILPLPLQLNDMTGIEASSADAGIANMTIGMMNKDLVGGQDLSTDARYYADFIQKGALAVGGSLAGSNNVITAAVGKLIGGAGIAAGLGTGSTGSLLSGAAINPYETMEFKGVKLKTHSFNWRLSPSSVEDSEAIKDIIKTIKMNILPSYIAVTGVGSAHNLLKYPKLAWISFLGIDQEYYYKLKPAMITSFNVRYNGGEQLNIFKGGKPVIVELAMELTEVNIHTSGDYGGAMQSSGSGWIMEGAQSVLDAGRGVVNTVLGTNL